MAKEYEDEAVTLSDAQELNEFLIKQQKLSSHPVFEVAPQANARSIQQLAKVIQRLNGQLSALRSIVLRRFEEEDEHVD